MFKVWTLRYEEVNRWKRPRQYTNMFKKRVQEMIFGIEFKDEPHDIDAYIEQLNANAEKDVVKTLFDTKNLKLDDNKMVVYSHFKPYMIVNFFFFFMLVIAVCGYYFLELYKPLIIILCIIVGWLLMNTPQAQYFVAKIGLKKMGYKGRTRLL